MYLIENTIGELSEFVNILNFLNRNKRKIRLRKNVNSLKDKSFYILLSLSRNTNLSIYENY